MSIKNTFFSNPSILQDVQVLIVDNDRDSRSLYAFLLEGHGARVASLSSVQDALDWLNESIPALLICEMRFLGESVYPLIQAIRHLSLSSGRMIPILVISTCSLKSLAQQLQVKVEAYFIKPIDLEDFLNKVWNLVCLSRIIYPPSIPDWVMQQNKLLLHRVGTD